MGRLGFWLIILGVGAFILPRIGLQFKLVSLFGQYQVYAAIAFAVIGVILVLIGNAAKKKNTQTESQG